MYDVKLLLRTCLFLDLLFYQMAETSEVLLGADVHRGTLLTQEERLYLSMLAQIKQQMVES